MTGRPRILDLRTCEVCPAPVLLRRRESFNSWMARRFCSRSCANRGRRAGNLERFWQRVSVGLPDECWLWSGNIGTRGYGFFRVYDGDNNEKRVTAHRYMVSLREPLDDSLVVMHSCDNPPCVNPAHLRQATQGENVLDAMRKGRLVPKKRRAA